MKLTPFLTLMVGLAATAAFGQTATDAVTTTNSAPVPSTITVTTTVTLTNAVTVTNLVAVTNVVTVTNIVTVTNSAPATNAVAVTNAPPKKNPWDASIALGATVTRGNSKTLLFSGSFDADKKWNKNEISLGANGVYGDNDGVKTAESLYGFGQYNRLFTERLYGYVRVDGLHDAIADIRYRITAGGGPGYYFIKTTNTLLRGEVGPGYVYERQTDGTTHSYMTLRVAERFEQKLGANAKLWEAVEYLPQVDKFENYIVNAEVGIESAMSKHTALQVVAQDNYHSEPADDKLKNDFKLIAALKYKF